MEGKKVSSSHMTRYLRYSRDSLLYKAGRSEVPLGHFGGAVADVDFYVDAYVFYCLLGVFHFGFGGVDESKNQACAVVVSVAVC
jgi:hypothetical protein